MKKIACLSALLLCSCVPLLVVGGGTVSSVAVRNRTGVSGSVSDNVIHANALNALAKANIAKSIDVSVKHSMVLLIGYVQNDETKRQAVSIASQIKGVKSVIDELKVGHDVTFEHSVVDTIITSRVKSSMVLDGNIHSFNFNITTYDGVVYILGTAENIYERDLVINIARSTSYVNKVIAYIDVANADTKEDKKSAKRRPS